MKKVLDPIVYWKLRAICSDAQRNYAVAVQAQDALTVAQKKQKDMLVELGFNPDAQNFRLNDDKLEVEFPDDPVI